MTNSSAYHNSQTGDALTSGAMNADSSAVPVSPNEFQPSRSTPLKISRDEMNLAEFPLTVLSKRSDPSVKTLEFSDSVKGKNGDVINRKWIMTKCCWAC